MNKQRRAKLIGAIECLNKAVEIIAYVIGEEQDSLESMPDNLQSSDKYQDMENTIDELYDIMEDIDAINDRIGDI